MIRIPITYICQKTIIIQQVVNLMAPQTSSTNPVPVIRYIGRIIVILHKLYLLSAVKLTVQELEEMFCYEVRKVGVSGTLRAIISMKIV